MLRRLKKWTKVRSLEIGNWFKPISQERRKAFCVVDFSFRDSDNTPAVLFESGIFTSVLFRIMPINPINFYGDFSRRNSEVNRVLSGIGWEFLNIVKSKFIKGTAGLPFNTRFPFEVSVASKATESSLGKVRGSDSKFSFTISAVDCMGGPSAFFRAIRPVKATSNVCTLVKELFTAPFTFDIFTAFTNSSAFNGTKGISIGCSRFNSEAIVAPRTNLCHSFRGQRVKTTGIGTKGLTSGVGVELLSAICTCLKRAFSFCFSVTLVRTISIFHSMSLVWVSLERTATKATSVNRPSGSSCRYRAFKTTVFTFFASGFKLFAAMITSDYHNTSSSVFDYTREYTIAKYLCNGITAEGVIPIHPSCRCRWVPRAGSGELAA